jgi:type IV pilus assembly protein PilE
MKQASSRRACAGFTLIDMMCAVTVAGVVSAIAVPAYQGAMQKTRRSEALVALLQAQMVQERFRADHASYGSLADLGLPATTSGGHYGLSVTDPTQTGYAIEAVATAQQSADTLCRHLRLVVDGFNVAYASGPDSSVGNAASANKKCWGQ